MDSLDYTDTYIFDILDDNDEEIEKYCSKKTKKKEIKQLIEKITDYSTKKLDDTVEEVKKLLGL
jgi:hypothetical protein